MQQLPRHSREIRRRPSTEQGRGLEKLGHAIEYLTDMNAHPGTPESASRFEAYQILSTASMTIFEQCAPVVSFSEKLRKHIAHVLRLDVPRWLRSQVK